MSRDGGVLTLSAGGEWLVAAAVITTASSPS